MLQSFIDLAGTRLHYRIDGDAGAPALVLANSLGTDLTLWDPQISELARDLRVVRYDPRGHGSSTATPGPYTIEQLGRDVLGLLDELGIERAHFCGLSFGGIVGMWLGIHSGWRIDRLILASTAPKIGAADVWNTRIARVREAGMAAIAASVIERWFTPGFIAQHPGAVAPVRAALERNSPDGYVAACAAVREADLRGGLGKITRRTLVISGAHDPVTPPAEGRALSEAIPEARYVELPASHLANIEAAAAFTGAVRDFLQP